MNLSTHTTNKNDFFDELSQLQKLLNIWSSGEISIYGRTKLGRGTARSLELLGQTNIGQKRSGFELRRGHSTGDRFSRAFTICTEKLVVPVRKSKRITIRKKNG